MFSTNSLNSAKETQMGDSNIGDDQWDPDSTDMFVNTQDSQGNTVSTKATPMHMNEIAARDVTNQCSCSKGTGENRSSCSDGTRPRNTRKATNRKEENLTRQTTSVRVAKAPPTTQRSSAAVIQKQDTRSGVAFSSSNHPKRTTNGKAPNILASQGKNRRDKDEPMSVDKTCESDKNRNVDHQRQQQEQLTTSDKQRSSCQQAESLNDNVTRRSDPDGVKRRRLDIQDDCVPSTSGYKRQEQETNVESAGKSTNATGSSVNTGVSVEKTSYAEVASDGEWNTQGGRNNGKSRKRDYPGIKSAPLNKNRELYIRGMSCADYRAYKDLEEAVKWYCKERKVNTIHQRVIVYNKENDSVGLKVVVRESDVENISSRGFWPEGITIRNWSDEKPRGRERFFVSDQSSSDESL